MTTLTVWKFNTAQGAEETAEKLKELQKQSLIEIEDAAIVSWPEGKRKPRTRQALNLAGLGALDGAFWGLLFGLIFMIPILGLAMGAGIGALTGSFADYGIDDDFIKGIKSKVTEGTSALFLLTGNATPDKVSEALAGVDMELIQSNLSNEEEATLREHFGV